LRGPRSVSFQCAILSGVTSHAASSANMVRRRNKLAHVTFRALFRQGFCPFPHE
jgi:hypothetical protein